MKNIIIILFILIPSIVWSQKNTLSRFDSLLIRCKVEFKKPKQLEQIEKESFRKIPHDVCFKDTKGNYEVRLYFQPLDSTIAWYENQLKKNPTSKSMKPNDFCKSVMMLAVLDASNNTESNYQVSPYPETTKAMYNADWEASAFVEVNYSNFDFKYCYITCLHKNDIADIYVYYLMNEKNYLFEIVKNMTSALRFK